MLEPSIGSGVIADACMDAGAEAVIGYEIDYEECKKTGQRYSCFLGDFLEAMPKGLKFLRCCANPPFSKNQDIKHVLHILENWLAPGGRLVAILPDKEYPKLDKYDPVEYKLPEGSFKESGAGVRTKLIVINLF